MALLLLSTLQTIAVVVLAVAVGIGNHGGTLAAETKSVKIVDAPVVSRAYYSTFNSKKLTARVSPANVRGPKGLMYLNGTCLDLTQGDYKYEVCPFQNVTQHEQSSRWNAYKGVLGVYQGWNVVNGSLHSMQMLHGDSCGMSGTYRQAEVVFICSAEHKLSSASEPSTCHYELRYQTPLACNSTLMAVYYLLNSSQQQDWRGVQELFFHNEITLKGLARRMDEIYIQAGLVPTPEDSTKNHGSDTKKEDVAHKSDTGGSSQFSSFSACEKAHGELAEKVKRLEAELATLRPNRTLNATKKNATSSNHPVSKVNASIVKGSPRHSDSERSEHHATEDSKLHHSEKTNNDVVAESNNLQRQEDNGNEQLPSAQDQKKQHKSLENQPGPDT
eukprot:scpid62961/ scgid33192/ N-acetylglucosamine-1-phosphotransferase subunit gamma; GlcNAc-1-phosphotransferase subunit gamma; UDP-N-acetylglucosamine-1-phosphotransferase subunit gamma